MVIDDLVMQGGRALAAMVLTLDILVSSPKDLMHKKQITEVHHVAGIFLDRMYNGLCKIFHKSFGINNISL